MMAYKIARKTPSGESRVYDAYFAAFDDVSSIDMKVGTSPAYPLPGEDATVTVFGSNYGSLPAEQVTLQGQLAKKDGSAQPQALGEPVVIDGHFQTTGTVEALFPFTMPENPQDYKLVITAWEDELALYPSVTEAELPFAPAPTVSNISAEKQSESEYAVCLEVMNQGNLNLSGAALQIEKVPENWGDPDATTPFTPVASKQIESIPPGDTVRLNETISVAEDFFGEGDTVELHISVVGADGTVYSADSIVLRKPEETASAASDIYINGSAQPEILSVSAGKTLDIETAVMPISARNGYYLEYSIGDPSVASVDPMGSVTGLKKGRTTLTVRTHKMDAFIFVNQDYEAYIMDGGQAQETAAQLTKTVPVEVTAPTSGGGGTSYYTITVTQTEGGKISPGTVSAARNTNKRFTITPDDGYEIEDVLINGKSLGAVKEYTFERIAAAGTITAKFHKTAVAEWKNPFTDVTERDWFYEAVKYTNANGLMKGTGDTTFAPDATVTRGMFVTVLYRMELEPSVSETSFRDVDAGAYYAKAIAWASANGIVNGISNTEFAPNQNITREQMAAMIQRYAQFKGVDTSTDTAGFADHASISDWARTAADFCSARGIMSGKGNGTFAPQDNATRAEAATVLMRALNALKQG